LLISSASSAASNVRTENPKGPKETPKKARFGAEYSSLPQTPFKQEVKPGMPPVTLDLKK
jgi:hypothetical protein